MRLKKEKRNILILFLILFLMSFFILFFVKTGFFTNILNKLTGNVISSENLIAYFSLDGNVNGGIINGSPQFVSGKIGQALSFDGIDDYVDTNIKDPLNLLSSVTISAWIYKSQTTSIDCVFSKLGNANGPYSFCIYSNNKLRMETSNSESNEIIYSSDSIVLNQWNHIVFWRNSSHITFYINGAKDSGGFKPYTSNKVAVNLITAKIGAKANNKGQYFEGKIDEIKVYDASLSETDIQQLYQEGDSLICTPDCTDKECGDDGCGEDCGSCEEGYTCDSNLCVNQSEINDSECISDCLDKECGDDGCGEDCGSCEIDEECVSGVCLVYEDENESQLTGEQLSSCIDTDVNSDNPDGINYNLDGEIQNEEGDVLNIDECANNFDLRELYCEDNIIKESIHNCENGCKEGVCLQEITYFGCHRTDDGNIYVKGQLCIYESRDNKRVCVLEDVCEDSKNLNQTECILDSEYKQESIECQSKCKNGACTCKEGDCPEDYICKKNNCIKFSESESEVSIWKKILEWIKKLFTKN